MNFITKRNLTIGAVVIGVPALIAAWWLISPLFLDTEVDEDFPMAATDGTPEGTETLTGDEPDASPTTTQSSSTLTTEAVPVALVAGEFRDADSSHRGVGSATIYQLEDGSMALRFEDFEVTNGPDLHVYLVPADNAGDGVNVSGYIDLGELKGNIGDQNYEIPEGTDIGAFRSVVIWCEPFRVPFSVATFDA